MPDISIPEGIEKRPKEVVGAIKLLEKTKNEIYRKMLAVFFDEVRSNASKYIPGEVFQDLVYGDRELRSVRFKIFREEDGEYVLRVRRCYKGGNEATRDRRHIPDRDDAYFVADTMISMLRQHFGIKAWVETKTSDTSLKKKK